MLGKNAKGVVKHLPVEEVSLPSRKFYLLENTEHEPIQSSSSPCFNKDSLSFIAE